MRRIAAVVIAGLLASSPTALAQDQMSLEQAVERLDSQDAETIRAGIEAIGLIGKPGGVEPLAARIRRGLPPELLGVALDTLTVLGQPEAGPILFELTSHRRVDVRTAAIDAIVSCEPDGASAALASAMADSHPRVRGKAATGLGRLGATGTVDSLFLALDRGVLEAAGAIGKVAKPEHVQRLLGYLGQVPFDSITPALERILGRDDIPKEQKLEVIAQLQELATPKVKAFLEDFVSSLPPSTRGRDAVRRAAEDAILRIAD